MSGFHEFLDALKKGDFDSMKSKYNKSFLNLDDGDSGATPLLIACRGGRLNIVAFLIDEGANIEQRNYGGWRPIHVAAFHGHPSTVYLLADSGCLLDEPDQRQWTPLHLACRRGNVAIVTYLINKRVNQESMTNDGERPFHVAVKWGKEPVVDVLIDNDCLLEERTGYGETALDLALREKKDDCAQRVMEALKVQRYLKDYKSATKEDSELLALLKSAEENKFEDIRKEKIVSVLYEVIHIFNEKYKAAIFDKIKNAPLNDIENSKKECLRLSVSVLGRIESELTREDLSDVLVAYLMDLYEVSNMNKELTTLSETFHLSLYSICRPCHHTLREGAVSILLKYFKTFVTNEIIRSSSAFVLAVEINRGVSTDGDDLNEVLSYLKDLLEQTKTSLSESTFGFIVSVKERVVIQKAVREGWKPSLINMEKGDMLGEGSYGNVFKYVDRNSKRSLAVKEVHNDGVVESIKEEIQRYAKWPFHESLLRYYGVISDGPTLKVFMEYMPLGSLKTKLDKDGPLQSTLIAKYTKQLLEGLDFLHERRIVHEDLRARNIFRGSDETIRLCVLGVCKSLDETTSVDYPGAGSYRNSDIGSVYWTAPEVIMGGHISIESNVWSLGATVLEMLTGNPPYHQLSHTIASEKIVTVPTIEYQGPKYMSTKLQSFLESVFVVEPQRRASVTNLFKSAFIYDLQLSESSFKSFEKSNQVGRGAIGHVYKCLHGRTKLYFAVKEVPIIKGKQMNDDIKSLENEINIYNKLESHDRILRYYGTSKDEKVMNIFMEYMPGGSLKDKLNDEETFPTPIIAKYIKQVLQGLEFLHQKNIIHRDIKAANILRDEDDNIKLCDFGFSKCLKTHTFNRSHGTVTRKSSTNKDMTDTCIGTNYYMAPEVVKGEKYGLGADVWSLGCTVVEMLTGNPPYHDLDYCAASIEIGTLSKVEYKLKEPISTSLQVFLDKMFIVDPRERADVKTLLQCDFIIDG